MDQKRKKPVEIRTIQSEEAGQRIDNYFLNLLKGIPKSHIYRLIREGQVRVNSGRIKPYYRLKHLDKVRIPPVSVSSKNKRSDSNVESNFEPVVIYEDEDLFIINKPAGIAVHGGTGSSVGVIELLRFKTEIKLELVHRIDKMTSGILILAKKRSALIQMHEMLRTNSSEKRIEKKYRTLLLGEWRKGTFNIEHYLNTKKTGSSNKKSIVDTEGKKSQSIFRPLTLYQDYSFMEVTLLTGRLHQVRAQAAEVGFPVIGDKLYGNKSANQYFKKFGLHRQFLHAHSVRFTHPSSGREVTASAPLSDDLLTVLTALKPTSL